MAKHERKTRFFRSSRYDAWRRARLGALLFPAYHAFDVCRQLPIDLTTLPREELLTPLGIGSVIALVSIYVLFAGFTGFFVWWCICTFMMSRSRREATFSPTRDIEYYRDKLDGLSAAQVSMLADLRIEPREDAAATILSLIMDGVVTVNGDELDVLDMDRVRQLPPSSRRLIRSIKSKNLDQSFQNWAEEAEREAVDGVYLRWRGEEGKTMGCLEFGLMGCGKGCLLTILISVVFGLVFMTGHSAFMDLIDSVENDFELLQHMVDNPMLVVEILLVVVLFLALLVAFALPFVDTVRGIIENGDASRRIARTPLGEEATECAYGIRNYVRDFTKLPEADRATLMLWDEFAVYAVALGESSHAVDEILASRGLSRRILGL